jgi:hypothetical protein
MLQISSVRCQFVQKAEEKETERRRRRRDISD